MNAAPEKCIKCGQRLRQRSDIEHNHFFAVIKAVYDSWPYADKFKPEDSEHLRSYLLIHAGHCTTVDFRTDGSDPKAFADHIMAVMRAEGNKHPMVHQFEGYLRVYVPKTMKKDECKVEDFRTAKAKVFEIVYARTGIDCKTVTGNEAA